MLGEHGRGRLEHLGVPPDRIDVFVVTFGKAQGLRGAAICGDRGLVEALINRDRGIIYLLLMALPLAAEALRALARVETESWRRRRLAEHVARLHARPCALRCPRCTKANRSTA